MVNYFIYAKDFSGSTQGVKYYHDNGIDTLDQFKSDVKKINKELLIAGEPSTESEIIYLHWGDKCYEVKEDNIIISYIKMKSGSMGTEPQTIIQWIQQNCDVRTEGNNIKLLYIITDGMICNSSIKTCFDLNKYMHYETVVFHAFNEESSEIDLSVAVTFLKKCCIIYRNYELFDNTNISEEFNYDKINVDNFVTEKDNLKSYIKLKYINTFNQDILALQEIDKLKKLRARLFYELSSKLEKNKVNLDTKDRDVFLREFINTDWYKNLNSLNHDAKVVIEKSISTLINYIVSDTKSYSFDALKFDIKFDKPVEEEPIIDVNFSTEQQIKFPDIILDDDKGIPVIILTEFNLLDKIIFHRSKESTEVSPASFSKFKSTMECPLFLLHDPDISESIGYFYTLSVYKQLLNTNKTEPRTRRRFHGGLVLTDTDEFDKYNDYILSATYFGFKQINFNIGLFYFVLWKNCENKEWMDRNVVEQFRKYVMRRVSATVCKIGLSSLPLDPQENTSLLTALWYCVELSSCIFKDDPQNYAHERLRMYYGVADCMIEILKYFNYDLDLECIGKRMDLIRHVMSLKRIPKREEKIYYLLKRIFKSENGFLVSKIENPLNLGYLNYLKLNHSGMLNDNITEEVVHLNDYVYLMHFEGNFNESGTRQWPYKICEKTFRPFFTIEQNKSFYTELVKDIKKVIINNDDDQNKINITYDEIVSLEFDRILSLYNLFINCVKYSNKYPTLSEYIDYIFRKNKFKDDLVTIFPPTVYLNAVDVYSLYQNIVAKVAVNQFIRVCNNNVKPSDRIKAEEILQYNNGNDINAFIASEAIKVSLKKKDGKLAVPVRFVGSKTRIFLLPILPREPGKVSKKRFIFKSF